jgi:hypothetical protein
MTMMMDTKTLECAMEFARNSAKSAPEYKAETYFAVLVSALLGSLRLDAPKDQTPSPRAIDPSSSSAQGKYSAGELFASRTWETEIEKVTLAGYFLERQSGMPNYSITAIRSCLVAAKVALPANINLAVLKAVQKGWMMEVPNQGEKHKVWALTQTGERKVGELANTDTK